MNNPTLYLVGGIFLILFFCVMVYFFTKTFRALHVVFLFFTFSMAIWFLVMAALSHKTRLHWRQRVNQLTKDLDTLVDQKDRLVNNWILDEDGNRPETVLTYRRKLNRVLLDRGRVWRSCSVAAVGNGAIQVNTAPAGVADPTPNQLDPNDIVFAFIEGDSGDPAVNIKVPLNFMGEFRATAVTPTSVTLQPVDPRLLLATQGEQIQASAGKPAVTWALYEIMPIDSHQIYAVDPNADVALTGIEGQAVFGAMDNDLIGALYNPERFIAEVNENLQLNNDPAKVQIAQRLLMNIVRDIQRDGGQPFDGGAASGGAVDPPENVFTKVQFETDFTVEVDSDSGQGALTSNYYDSQGRAVVDRLRRNELDFLNDEKSTEIAFKQGDFAIFNKEKADELIEAKTVKPIEPRYVRTLIDFTYEAHKILDRRTRIGQDLVRVGDEIRKTNEAEVQTKRQRDFRQQERDKLMVDKSKFVAEQQQATTYASQLQQKMSRLRGELSALYRSNSALAARLAQRSEKLTNEINARTAAATADSGD